MGANVNLARHVRFRENDGKHLLKNGYVQANFSNGYWESYESIKNKVVENVQENVIFYATDKFTR